MASGFSPKTQPLNWQTILSLDIGGLQSGELEDDPAIESLYYQLVNARLDPSDPQCSLENLFKLFQATQLLIELQHIYSGEDQQKIKEQQQQINRLENTVNGTLNRGGGSPFGFNPSEIYKLQEEVRLLEERNHYAVRNLQISEQNLQRERDSNRDLLKQLDEQRAQNGEQLNQISDLKREIADLKLNAQQQQEIIMKQLNAQREFELHAERDRSKNIEISRYLDEIKALSEQNANLEAELDTVYLELEKADKNAAAVANERRQIDEELSASDRQLDSIIQERDALRAKIYEISQQMDWKEGMEKSMLDSLQSQVSAWRSTLAEHQRAILERDKLIESLQTDLQSLKSRDLVSATAELERQLTLRDSTINTLRQSLEQARGELNSVLNRPQSGCKSLVNIPANEKQSDRETYLAERLAVLEETLAEKEDLLLETRDRLQRAEKGTDGLTAALDEIEDLKRQRRLRDEDLLKLTGQINECQRLIAALDDENSEIRKHFNVPESFSVDASLVKASRQGELERLRTQNEQLQRDYRLMEDEIIELKKKLRFSALDKSGRAATALGITASLAGNQQHEGLSALDWERLKLELDTISGELRLSNQERNELLQQLGKFRAENTELQQSVRQLSKDLTEYQRRPTLQHERPQIPPVQDTITQTTFEDSDQEQLKLMLTEQEGKGTKILEALTREIENTAAKDKLIADLTEALNTSRLELDATTKQMHLLYSKSLAAKTKKSSPSVEKLEDFIKGLGSEIRSQAAKLELAPDAKTLLVAQVTAQSMTRKCQLMETEIKAKREECKSLADNILALEHSARHEILRLQQTVTQCKKDTDRLELQIEQSVPASTLIELRQQYEDLAIRYQQSIYDEAELVKIRCQLKECQIKIDNKRTSSTTCYNEESLAAAQQQSNTSQTPADERHMKRTIENLKGQIVATEQSVKRNEEDIARLEEELQRKEQEISITKHALTDSRAQLSQSVPKQSFAKLQGDFNNLKSEYDNLTVQVQFYRETGDTAIQQLEQLQKQQTIHEQQMDQLKKNIQDLSVQSDHHTLLSNLHQQIINGKTEAARLQEQVTVQTRRNERLDRGLQRCFDSLRQKDQRIEVLKCTLAHARLKQMTVLDKEIAKYFRIKNLNQQPNEVLVRRCEWLSAELERTSGQLAECQAQMAQTTQSSALLIDLHNTINQSSDSSSQKQKLIAIEKQLSKWASENMTLQRKLFESERQSSRFEQLCSDLEKHAGKIQKVCLASDDEYQKEINRLEGRLMELEDQLLAINEDHDRALRASTASIEQLTGSVDAPTAESKTKFAAKLNYQSSSSEDFPNPAWSIGRQLEFCIQRIADKNTLVSGLTKEINQMQMKLVDSEGSLQMTRTKLDDKNAEVLRLEQTAKSLADMQPQMEKLQREHQEQLKNFKSRISLSQEVNQSLQRQLQCAREQVQKYQDLIKKDAKEHGKFKQEQLAISREMNTKLREAVCQLAHRDAEVEQLRKQLEQLRDRQDSADAKVANRDANLFSLQDLRLALQQKEQKQLEDIMEIQKLQKALDSAAADNIRLTEYCQRSELDVVELKRQLDQLQEQLIAQQTLAKQTADELETAQLQLSKTNAKVSKVTVDLASAKTMEMGLRSALTELQERMTEMTQKQWYHQHDGVECPTNKLRAKIARLEIEIGRLKMELTNSKSAIERNEAEKRAMQSKLKVLQSTGRPKSASAAEVPHQVFDTPPAKK